MSGFNQQIHIFGIKQPKIYNLDMILSVGYRVNSKRGIVFRRWANSVLKQYVIQGYAINEKRLQALERTDSDKDACMHIGCRRARCFTSCQVIYRSVDAFIVMNFR